MNYEQQKRILDISVALLLTIMFLPVWIVVPLMIYIDSGLPILFKHQRIGLNGKSFGLYKFRSMIPNADEILHKHNKELLEQFKKGDWKIENDPRITRLGKALRSLTIDEFPQLYNVIRGEMSMVGPRAYVKKELDQQTKKYPSTKKYRDMILSVKPGITGPWQTSGRNEIPFAQNKSIFKDIIILFKTPQAMISKW